MSTFLDFIYL